MRILVLSPVSLDEVLDGHRLAIMSDTLGLHRAGADITIIAFHGKEMSAPSRPSSETGCSRVYHIKATSGGRSFRAARAVFTAAPAESEKFYNRRGYASLRILKEQSYYPDMVLIQDSLMGGYIPLARESWPRAKIVLRSHNVMELVSKERASQTNSILRIAAKWEARRWQKLEATSMAGADQNWAITLADADYFRNRYPATPTTYIPVSVPVERYRKLATGTGSPDALAHLGSLDTRRYADMRHFLDRAWPAIRMANPSMRLLVAGRLKVRLKLQGNGIDYLGVVEDDTNVYSQALYALNVQRTTGGVKLKSLTALAAGRLLISTQSGIEGMAVQDGVHYLDLDRVISTPDLLSNNPFQAAEIARIAQSGRDWVETHHGLAAVTRSLSSAL